MKTPDSTPNDNREGGYAVMTGSRADGEPRVRTLLREMIAAIDAGDEKAYFACFEWLQNVTLKMLEPENTDLSRPPAEDSTSH